MGDDSGEETRVNEDEKKFEDEINKEISKLKYFLEEADELIENSVDSITKTIHTRVDGKSSY